MWFGPSGWGGWWHGGWSLLGFVTFAALVTWLVRRPSLQSGPHAGTPATCPHCGEGVKDAYFRCPECGHTLKTHCPACSRVVETRWSFCPYCREAGSSSTAAETRPQEGDTT